jgi:hypothetical protein
VSRPRKAEAYVLTWRGTGDPDRREVGAALSSLGPFRATEVLPGTIRIVGDARSIQAAVGSLAHWRLAPEGRLACPPPHRTILAR